MMNWKNSVFRLSICCISMLLMFYGHLQVNAQGVTFPGDFSPAEGLTISQEAPYRQEICLNGSWELQLVPVPSTWERGSGNAPELTKPEEGKWETVKIKIPSAINVNNWGNGNRTGEGTDYPYAPSSVYFPSYPKYWDDARMGWLRRSISIPGNWDNKRLIIHFEAVAGECVVLINGKVVCRNFDSHLPFDADITDYVIKNEVNELLLGLRHTKLFDKSHPVYTKFGATYPPGSNTDDLLGIWQDVFLFGVPDIRITDVFVKPWLDKDELELDINITNQSGNKKSVSLSGEIRSWINNASSDVIGAAEIKWELGDNVLSVNSALVEIKPNETKTVTIRTKVQDRLKMWSPSEPNLYTLLLNVNDKKQTYDRKATRFGWRQFSIVGKDFHLNGKKIQCFGDIQHPFSAYICSRRFAWAWYQMIKDFGGNAVRPHAQPWPRVYYDLADEMGLMVLDETGLFGSSIRLNLEEDITWQRSQEHLNRLIVRDRNHPSVIGWSAGNEMFAIALLNQPEKEVSDKWDDKLVKLTLSARNMDPTRDFITLDGDRDMNGRLPVWSKHFAHGLKLEDLPSDLNKPLIVGESGATYYGRPAQLYPFAGDKAFESYYGRNEALAVDVYQNAVQMAKPYLAYFSPSEVCWFGIEHMNLGYHDYSRLPGIKDGIFAGKSYKEGQPGYQYERIPPYVTTFNPGLDPDLPLYKSLPMFMALQAALSEDKPQDCPWDTYKEIIRPDKPPFPAPIYKNAFYVGNKSYPLYNRLLELGLNISSEKQSDLLILIDGEDVTPEEMKQSGKNIEKAKKEGGLIWVFLSGKDVSPAASEFLPFSLELTSRQATSLESNKATGWGKYFDLPDLYFAEIKGDRHIMKQGLSGEIVSKGDVILSASETDWTLFNEQPENRKCAQVVLYEHLKKPEGAVLITLPYGKATLVVSSLDYKLNTSGTTIFWENLLATMKIGLNQKGSKSGDKSGKEHNLLLDGPVD